MDIFCNVDLLDVSDFHEELVDLLVHRLVNCVVISLELVEFFVDLVIDLFIQSDKFFINIYEFIMDFMVKIFFQLEKVEIVQRRHHIYC